MLLENRSLPSCAISSASVGGQRRRSPTSSADAVNYRSNISGWSRSNPGKASDAPWRSHVEGLLEHLESNDVTYAVVARAPLDDIEIVRKPMAGALTGSRPTAPTATMISMYLRVRRNADIMPKGRNENGPLCGCEVQGTCTANAGTWRRTAPIIRPHAVARPTRTPSSSNDAKKIGGKLT